MIRASISQLLEDSVTGYWGGEVGTAAVDVRVIRNGDMKSEGGIRWERLPTRGFSLAEASKSRLRSGDILLTSSADCGQVALIDDEPTDMVCATNFVRVLRFTQRVHPRYAWHYMRTEQFRDALSPYIRGTTMKNLSTREAFPVVDVPLPPLAEQRRIAAILSQADALRAKRRQVLAMQSALSIAMFAEMFRFERGQIPLGEIADVRGGKRLPKGVSYSTERTPHPYIRVVDLVDGVIETSNVRYIDEGVHSGISRYVVAVNDVVISIAGTIGSVAAVPTELVGANLTENAARIVPRVPGIYRAEWLAFALRTPDLQAQIRSHVGQVTIGKLALFRIEKLKVAVPSLDQQDRFLSRVAALREWSAQTRRVATEEDELFTSLRGRAFRGEL